MFASPFAVVYFKKEFVNERTRIERSYGTFLLAAQRTGSLSLLSQQKALGAQECSLVIGKNFWDPACHKQPARNRQTLK